MAIFNLSPEYEASVRDALSRSTVEAANNRLYLTAMGYQLALAAIREQTGDFLGARAAREMAGKYELYSKRNG